ncbi:MAG: GNAT family N-acetyltransferase [Microlunatus sp.]|nr:GNAT family N-acetyltransferase [Microlunatus sp.]
MPVALDDLAWPLKTARLQIRRAAAEDVDAVYGYRCLATRALLRVCFAELGLRRVTAGCFADNIASWRLMERLGMRREAHTIRDSLHRSGRWLDGLRYALLAEEWKDLSPE